MLSIDAIISAKDGKTIKVACPEWGGDVYLTTMASDLFDEFGWRISNADSKPSLMKGIRAEFVAACLSDEQGNRQTLTPKQLDAFKQKSPVIMTRLFTAAQELHEDVGAAEGN